MGNPSDKKEIRIKPEWDFISSNSKMIMDYFERETAEHKNADVVLDMKGVKLIDSVGIGVVAGFYKECIADKKGFSIEIASKDLSRIFKILNMDKIFEVKLIEKQE